ncbi:hypothetical protein [Streptomyces prasinus]
MMMTLFAKDGSPKVVPACTMPLTSVGCVSRIYSDHATIDVGTDGPRIVETWGVGADELRSRLAFG